MTNGNVSRLMKRNECGQGSGGGPRQDDAAFRERRETPTATRRPTVILYLSSRAIRNDFRYPLVEEWRRLGVPCRYILMGRRPRVSAAFSSDALADISLATLPSHVRKAIREAGCEGGEPAYFDTTGLALPATMTALRPLLPAGLWCFDLNDDYAYNATGWRRRWRTLQTRIRAGASDMTLHAATSLRELVPDAVSLPNASTLLPFARPAADPKRILVMGSIDWRYDFDLLADIARLAPDLAIDLWGHIHQDLDETRTRVETLTTRFSNITHFGRYEPDGARAILARYNIGLAPYRTGVRVTRYIDPIRYYNCLNVGLELLATDIPMTDALGEAVHRVGSAEEAVAIVRRLAEQPSARRNRPELYRPVTWEQRAREFLDLYARAESGRLRAGR